MNHKGIRGGMVGLVTMSGAVALAATALAAGAVITRFGADLRDYDTTTSSPFDHASARLQLASNATRTTAVLHVRGIDTAVAGQTFGAHLHTGPCSANAPTLAGGHYNHDIRAGITPVVVSDETEVWLDFTVDATGAGDSATVVRFEPDAGVRSVVIHASPTNPATGTAGARLACLPVEW